MAILTDPAVRVHKSWCDTVWHSSEDTDMYEQAVNDGRESDPDYLACSSEPIEIPAGTARGDALIYQSPAGTRVSVEFPHRALVLSADELDAMLETLTRLAVIARASQ